MRDILVDQATMLAVRRLEGDVSTEDAKLSEGDVLALESLMQAILFYDNILYVDCAGLKSRDRTRKNFEKLCTIILENENYLDLIDETNHIIGECLPCIKDGRFTDSMIADFFRALAIDIRFLWVKRGNLYNLAQSIVDVNGKDNREYYQTIFAMIFSERQDGAHYEEIARQSPLLYDSCGQIVNQQYKMEEDSGTAYHSKISYQTDVMFQGLNAMMFRTIFDATAGKELKACNVLYPTRSALLWNELEKACIKTGVSSGDFLDIHQNLPMMSAWMALQNKHGCQRFIDMAFDLREEVEFIRARACLDELYDMMNRGKSQKEKDIGAVLTIYEQQMNRIREKYQVVKDEEITFPSVIRYVKKDSEIIPWLFPRSYAAEVEEPDYSVDEKSSFALWHRWLVRDLNEIKKLDAAYDAVTAKVTLAYDAELSNLKVETPGDFQEEKWWRRAL